MSTRAEAVARDAEDPLAAFRTRFLLPAGRRYFDGNSLGAPAIGVAERVARVVAEEWGDGLIDSWTTAGWLDLPRQVARRLAPFLGVMPDEVAVADATSVNLFKLLGAVLTARPRRRRVVVPEGNFPSDLYITQSVCDLLGAELVRVPPSSLGGAVDERTSILTLSHVDFRSGELFDLAALSAVAHAHGALLLADLCHSVGAMPLALADWEVDLAVGCGYKFLGGGPGAPAFLVVRQELQGELRSPLAGWLSHAEPFAFEVEYRPAAGVDRFLCGTPPILSLAALDAALEAWEGIDLGAVRRWAESLGDFFVGAADVELSRWGVDVLSPRAAARRGAQVSLRHAQAAALVAALARRGIVGDFRPPDVLRFGLHPLYLRHVDVWEAVVALRELVARDPT